MKFNLGFNLDQFFLTICIGVLIYLQCARGEQLSNDYGKIVFNNKRPVTMQNIHKSNETKLNVLQYVNPEADHMERTVVYLYTVHNKEGNKYYMHVPNSKLQESIPDMTVHKEDILTEVNVNIPGLIKEKTKRARAKLSNEYNVYMNSPEIGRTTSESPDTTSPLPDHTYSSGSVQSQELIESTTGSDKESLGGNITFRIIGGRLATFSGTPISNRAKRK